LLAAVCFTLAFSCTAPGLLTDGRAGAAIPVTPAVDVTFTGRTTPIPKSFFGLSIEYTELGDFEQIGPAFDNVLAMLSPGDGSPLLLRLGGRSADQVVWMPTVREPPATEAPQPISFETSTVAGVPTWVRGISPAWVSELAQLVRRDHLNVEPELNLVVHSPTMAVQFTRALRAALPPGSVTGVAIGNEPDLYRKQPWLQKERIASTSASTRRRWTVGYSPASYRSDYLTYARALRQAFPNIRLSAPDIAYPSLTWSQQLLSLKGLAPNSIAVHRYATATCKTHEILVPNPLSFLQDRYTAGLAQTLLSDIAFVHQQHADLRVTEMNSFTCGGRQQIAESYATALWAPDAIFEMLRVGVSGVNWHIHPALPNSPFHLTAHGIVPLPELYGLAVFAQMIGPHPLLVRVHVSDTLDRSLKVWAVSTTDGLKVLALDKGPQPVTVLLHDPFGTRTGYLARLTAPTVASQTGVTFAGQSIGSDGRWHGRRIETPVADRHGVYTFGLPAFTGAVLTIGR
jgi:hypothetical protein